ncbi:unnamed protein product [Caenorhabditis auriculariae]|uniref:Probable oligoribonuclease n=1 Tax=Caenorhabditis auriculariae TaxID=2777116 RepID=A0A8S1H150_9PELO|nr:unnamed protein product [Caenorhabditis auriculariae]
MLARRATSILRNFARIQPVCKMSESTLINAKDDVNKRIIWIDCEMTGIGDAQKQTLVEIATIVTDSELNTIAVGPDIVINQPKEVLDNMEEWPRNTFLQNGLMQKILDSKISLKQAEDQVIEFLRHHAVEGKAPIAGNSIHMDRLFLHIHMPRLNNYAHYRCIDVSSVKGIVQRWYPDSKEFEKKKSHRALDDILESIDELKYLRTNFFK